MNKEDVLQFLKDNLYIISDSSNLVITSKFYRDFGIRASDAKSSDSIKPTRASNPTIEDYAKFIEEAEVPTFLPNGQGGKYYANRVSQKGFKAFKVAASKTDEKVLLAACKWYYKQNNTSRVMIGTWFAEDIWISCVNDIKKAIENRDKKVVSMGNPIPDNYPAEGVWIPKIEEEGSSNMEQG